MLYLRSHAGCPQGLNRFPIEQRARRTQPLRPQPRDALVQPAAAGDAFSSGVHELRCPFLESRAANQPHQAAIGLNGGHTAATGLPSRRSPKVVGFASLRRRASTSGRWANASLRAQAAATDRPRPCEDRARGCRRRSSCHWIGHEEVEGGGRHARICHCRPGRQVEKNELGCVLHDAAANSGKNELHLGIKLVHRCHRQANGCGAAVCRRWIGHRPHAVTRLPTWV